MPRFLALVALMGLVASGRPAEIRFETVPAQQTGIQAIFERWYEEEMVRQGGPGKSHGWWLWGLRAIDYDRDGDLDLVASHHGTPRSIILKNLRRETGQLRFQDAMQELKLGPRDLPGADDRPWIWDFDGDGFLDIAGFSDESPAPSAWNQQGKQFLGTGKPLFHGLSHPREVIDLDGDGYLDLDGGSKGQWFYLPEQRTFRHEAKPRFAVPAAVPAELIAELAERKKAKNNRGFGVLYLTHALVGYDWLGYDPRPIDLDGDGRHDVVVHGSGGYGADYVGRYLLGAADGNLVDRTRELGLPETGAPIFIDDLTGDGFTDLLIAGEKDSGLYVNNGQGRFERRDHALSKFLTRRDPYLLRANRVDLDNDGDWDLVISSPRLGRVGVFENRGGGDFALLLQTTGWDSNPIVIADLDDDGRQDLVIGTAESKERIRGITIYLNRTTDAGNHLQIWPRLPAPNPYAVGAVVEVFRPGDLDRKPARPILVEKAHPDATPVHAGLGAAATCDLRITFPGRPPLIARGIQANRQVIADLETGQVRPK